MPFSDVLRRTLIGCFALFAIAACQIRSDRAGAAPSADPAAPAPMPSPAPLPTASVPSAPSASPAPAPEAPLPAPRILPALDREPEVGVLLLSGPRVTFTLLAPGRLQGGGGAVDLPAGPVTVEATANGWRLAGSGAVVRGEGVVTVRVGAGQPAFRATLAPPLGKPPTLTFSGRAVLSASRGVVQLIERLPLERYLAGVLPVEMNPAWPTGALAAQAIAARSYACARWMERFDQPWQLHWHYTVDMAYGGSRATSPNVRAALAATRGRVLMTRGMPVLALFHASSGGATEAAGNVWPGLLAPDGKTVVADVMRVADDPAAASGAKGLGLGSTHQRWKADVALADVTSGLQAWSAEKPGRRPTFGVVTGVRPGRRFPDSQRVATVIVSHRLGKKKLETAVPGNEFRLAVGPGVVRSTAWDRCVIASKGGGTLVLQGRGFGHGVGLSQVSAWWLAQQGVPADQIVARFYPGAELRTAW